MESGILKWAAIGIVGLIALKWLSGTFSGIAQASVSGTNGLPYNPNGMLYGAQYGITSWPYYGYPLVNYTPINVNPGRRGRRR